MSKLKSLGDRPTPVSLELDEEQLAALQLIPEALPPSLQCFTPVLESIRKAYGNNILPCKKTLPTRQATDFKRTTYAAEALRIDYEEDDVAYLLSLDTQPNQTSEKLSDHFASVIKDIKTKDYVSVRQDESFCRTVLDLIIMDRLRHMEEKKSYRRFQLSNDVPISIRIWDNYGNGEVVQGRADWALGYGTDKSHTGDIFLVVEAKPYEPAPVGMPQLLICMAAVQEATQDPIIRNVRGMISDGKEFRFCVLNQGKKFFTSRPYLWAIEQSAIIAHIDMMLLIIKNCSPDTTTYKENNRTAFKYPELSDRQWKFVANDAESEARGSEDRYNHDMVDIVNIGGRVVMRGAMDPDGGRSPG